MPRKARELSETNIYHVVVRGADRQLIFLEERDYFKYLDFLSFYKEECGFELYAYCLMSNHVHLLIRVKEVPLATIFRKLNTSYAQWFNGKYQRTGFLQQGRYYSEPVNNECQFMTTVCYIHHNAVKAGLEGKCGEQYRWSSFTKILSHAYKLVDGAFVEKIFGGLDAFLKAHEMYDERKADCLDVDKIRIRIPDDVARDIISQICGCSSPKEFQKLTMTDQRKYIAAARKNGLSIRQINRLTGVSKGIIERISV